MFDDLVGNPTCLCLRIKRLVIPDLFATGIRRPEILAFALDIVLNHRAGYIENCLRRAIILLEANCPGIWEVLFEVKDV